MLLETRVLKLIEPYAHRFMLLFVVFVVLISLIINTRCLSVVKNVQKVTTPKNMFHVRWQVDQASANDSKIWTHNL